MAYAKGDYERNVGEIPFYHKPGYRSGLPAALPADQASFKEGSEGGNMAYALVACLGPFPRGSGAKETAH